MQIPIVIRSSGERTIELSLYSVEAAGFPRKSVTLIDNVGKPFYEVLVRSLNLAASRREPHVLVLDADVVLFPGARKVIAACVDKNGDFARLEFQRVCKFTTKTRGVHLYNTDRLRSDVLPHVSSVPPDHLKPETELIRRVYAAGAANVQRTGPFVAWHDYEQYFAHIYRKMVVRALRDPTMLDVLERRAKQHAGDFDFHVALAGFRDGLRLGQEALRLTPEVHREKTPIRNFGGAYAMMVRLLAQDCLAAGVGGDL